SHWSAQAAEERTSLSRRQCRAAFRALVTAGVLILERPGRHPIYKLPGGADIPNSKFTEARDVWLPNSLIDGAAGEIPPLELLNQTQNPHALHLLVMLYAEHLPLDYDGGIPRRLLRVEQARQWLAEHGATSVRLLAKLWGWHPSTVQ